jgi:hypothetical protein
MGAPVTYARRYALFVRRCFGEIANQRHAKAFRKNPYLG